MLEKYHVKPLSSFTFSKNDDGVYDFFVTQKPYVYGYFREDGTLYKIYQPYNKDKKFMKLATYIQGMDKLKFDKPHLVITSSLKDGMCLKKIYPGVDFLAPDSENTMIKKEYLDGISSNYKTCYILFDNDEADNRSTVKYCNQFNYLKPLYLQLSKDIPDSVMDHGYAKVKEYLPT